MADLVAMASEMVDACVQKDWTRAYDNADPKFVKGFTQFMLTETWRQVRTVAGNFVETRGAREYRHLLAPIRVVFLECQFERVLVSVEVSFNTDDKILGLALLTPGFE